MNGKRSDVVVAIHDKPGSFSDRWIQWCRDRGVRYQSVNAYSGDIVTEIADCTAFLWHWSDREPQGLVFARSIIAAAEAAGLQVFPNTRTCWHYDDKVAQSYLLSAIGADLVPFYVFFENKEAERWIDRATWPKVFKLRGGSASRLVSLVEDRSSARTICRKSFGDGHRPAETLLNDAATKLRRLRSLDDIRWFLGKRPRAIVNWRSRRKMPRERGYVYFQDFLPDNSFDTRITVIGDRTFAFRRMVRPGDFRASGSGRIDHGQDAVDKRCFTIARNVADRLKTQSIAFDFVQDANGSPKIVEISYCYQAEAVHNCPGHYDRDMNWHEGHFWPQDCILEDLIGTPVGAFAQESSE